ncbi:MAG: AAA family ATPase, partial [Polyangiaceae bacterium]|nr:AAA family ATPase [Polyangiaceae bacterium]
MGVTFSGSVERITFENNETGFRVVRLQEVQGLTDVSRTTIVGVMPSLGVGTRVRVNGQKEESSQHGEQVRVSSVVPMIPSTLDGLEKYLGSGVIPRIGPGFAKRIVQYFGKETLAVLDEEPHRLREVTGLGESRVREIMEGWAEHRALSNVLLALQAHGASPGLAGKIVDTFGEKAPAIVQNEPYRLALEVPSVGFLTADALARAQGLSRDDPQRVVAGLLHILRKEAEKGHCFCERHDLLSKVQNLLQVEVAEGDVSLETLGKEAGLVIEETRFFLSQNHLAETVVAQRIAELLQAPTQPVRDLDSRIQQFEKTQGMTLAPQQREAVVTAVEQKVAVITGGPGVGKTTIVKAIVEVLAAEKLRVALAAPTGRAAKRLSESTGRQAKTIHRLLEVEGRAGGFQRNADRPLEVDLLIVDESSMIDISLARHLLNAVPNAARVVFVGDADQLPSVGAGAVLGDMIASGVLPVTRLDVIFRQAEESGIVRSSHAILRGEKPDLKNAAEGDFFFI